MRDFDYEDFKSLTNGTKKIIQCTRDGTTYTARILPNNKDFIAISSPTKANPCPEGETLKKFKLKFHISLPEEKKDENDSDFTKGFNIISNTLLDNGVNFFKVIKPGIKMSDQPGQQGKDVTIYAEYNQDKNVEDWQKICTYITQQLSNNDIAPGYKQVSTIEKIDQKKLVYTPYKEEKYIQGSNYLSYRYEGLHKGDESIGSGRKKIWKPILSYPQQDLCEKIIVNVENQKPNPEWTPAKNDKNAGIQNRI